MYYSHPSQILVDLFKKKPFQGITPENAKFLFIGLDANYSENIESEVIFPKIKEYHEDGELFWKRYGVHHPFLLPEYFGGGRFYHKSFSCIGFTEEHADMVSFVELLHLPTTGRSKLTATDLDAEHLRKLSAWIIEGTAEHIFVSSGVIRLMKATKLFTWLPSKPVGAAGVLKVLFQSPRKNIYQHLHFSNYGKFEQQKQKEAEAISHLLVNKC